MTDKDEHGTINLGGIHANAEAVAENITSVLKEAHAVMEPGDVFKTEISLFVVQSAVGLSPDEMRAHIVRQLRALATHLAS